MENIPQWFIDLMDMVTNYADGEYDDCTLADLRDPRVLKSEYNIKYSYQYVWEQIQKNLKESN